MSMDQAPTTPGRPRAQSRGLSFASNKSGGSEGTKLKQVESPKDKARRDSFWKGASKANPNAAIIESQPGGMFTLHSIVFAKVLYIWLSYRCHGVHYGYCYVGSY